MTVDERYIDEELEIADEASQVRVDKVDVAKLLDEPIRVLDPGPPICCDASASIRDAVAMMQKRRIGCLLVTEGDQLAGVITERDLLLKLIDRGLDGASTPVSQLMTRDPETLHHDDPLALVLNKMSVGGFRHVPLVDEQGRPTGIVSVKDVVDYIVDILPPSSVANLPPDHRLVARSREGG